MPRRTIPPYSTVGIVILKSSHLRELALKHYLYAKKLLYIAFKP